MTKNRAYLLDANVLIALATPDHSQNARATAWFLQGHRFATCPITQGALVRFHLRAGVGSSIQTAKLLLRSITALPRHEFWPDDASYLEMPTAGIIGHRQVTDAYLVLLSKHHDSLLVTTDDGLAAVHSDAAILI